MANLFANVVRKGLIKDYPHWLTENIHYLTIMGSQAYGVTQNDSDMDVYGWCIPPKELIFPHLAGEIEGFETPLPRFGQFQMHHVFDKDKSQEYDFTIFSVVKYFNLIMGCNPNMIDSLFTPLNCVLHISNVGQLVRDNRKQFLSKKAWATFRGYAYAQISKMTKIDGDSNKASLKRKANIKKYGFDLKQAYHVARLVSEVEQILLEHDIDLQRNNEYFKAIRRGEIELDTIKNWFSTKENELEKLYLTSTLREKPDEEKIKQLLVNCLESHYGSLEKAVVLEKNYSQMGNDIRNLLKQYGV